MVVAPSGLGVGVASGTGSCPQGWYTCAAGDGGECCPTGYSCGDICTATSTGVNATPATQPKLGASEGTALRAWKGQSGLIKTIVILLGMAIGHFEI